MKPITLGSDPELHLMDKQEGKIVSSLRILRQDKHHPIDLGDGIRMYADNVLTEAAHPPSEDPDKAVAMMKTVLARVHEKIGPRYGLEARSAHVYHWRELRGKKCWETGCNPNYNAYSRTSNPPADFQDGMRTGSFHLHIGHPLIKGMDNQELMVKLMDVFVGCSSILFDKDPTSYLRRALYGMAGEFRPTPYGVEYRVLGNWALRSPQACRMVWELALHSIHHFEIGDAKPIVEACGEMKVQLAINTNDKPLAKSILEVAALPMKLMNMIESEYPDPGIREAWGI